MTEGVDDRVNLKIRYTGESVSLNPSVMVHSTNSLTWEVYWCSGPMPVSNAPVVIGRLPQGQARLSPHPASPTEMCLDRWYCNLVLMDWKYRWLKPQGTLKGDNPVAALDKELCAYSVQGPHQAEGFQVFTN